VATLTRQNALRIATLAAVPLFALAFLALPLPPAARNVAQIALTVGLPVAAASALLWRWLMRPRAAPSPVLAIVEHLIAAVVFSAALTAAIVAVAFAVQPEEARVFLSSGDAAWQFVYGFVIYGAVAAAAHAAHVQARLRERELAATRAELQALRARLDPHFLFNTLHSLTQLAREDPAATEAALERFGKLMRYVLSAGHEQAAHVPLEDELAFVHDYLAIEKLRLGERLRVVEDVDPDALELAVPPLVLQPLVENAVKHGLSPRRDGGTIRLEAHTRAASLELAVADDGNGTDPEAWRAADGLGLRSVQRQLEARYGRDGKLAVATRRGHGFAVRLTLPATVPKGGAP
jgi:signal transduction histidine kinase